MAILGAREHRVVYRTDPKTKKRCFFWLRRLPLDVEFDMRKPYMVRIRNKKTGETRKEFDEGRSIEFLLDRLSWIWRRTENLTHEIQDSRDSAFFSEQLKKEPELKISDEILLDKHLTDETKRYICTVYPDVAEFIIERHGELAEEHQGDENEHTENLETGSSGSGPPAIQK